MQEKYY